MNQAEGYRGAPTLLAEGVFRGEIPAEHTRANYPLQYYVVMRGKDGGAWLHPGFSPEPANAPYFVLPASRPWRTLHSWS